MADLELCCFTPGLSTCTTAQDAVNGYPASADGRRLPPNSQARLK
jgi:hypothetical protein